MQLTIFHKIIKNMCHLCTLILAHHIHHPTQLLIIWRLYLFLYIQMLSHNSLHLVQAHVGLQTLLCKGRSVNDQWMRISCWDKGLQTLWSGLWNVQACIQFLDDEIVWWKKDIEEFTREWVLLIGEASELCEYSRPRMRNCKKSSQQSQRSWSGISQSSYITY
jgi:hypothetical protein